MLPIITLATLLVIGWPIWHLNIAHITALRYLSSVPGASAVEALAALEQLNDPGLYQATLRALALLGSNEPGAGATALAMFHPAIKSSTLSEQWRTGLLLEQQAERWARTGEQHKAAVTFKLLAELQLPLAEPYLRAGEFIRATPINLGITADENFEYAVTVIADTPRDRSAGSMAYTRLCEIALRRNLDYEQAIELCWSAIQLDNENGGFLSTWHTPLAYIMRGEALAHQQQFADAIAMLEQSIMIAPSPAYAEMARYTLARYVYEEQGKLAEATAIYRIIGTTEPASAYVGPAHERLAILCSQGAAEACHDQP